MSILKTVERILIKIIVIQFVSMLLSQFVFHKFEIFPELHQLARYEGVSEDNFSEILETFNGR
ncbi:YpfB family protein [Bacillus sp. DNRA2]|uniref:YpfB family protein n=1 Tax=Bacillus sp. DNRA2 TaxID=2723053 RepID=UPI0032B7C515